MTPPSPCAGTYASALSGQPPTVALREIHYVMGTLLDITLHQESGEKWKRLLRGCFQEARRLEHVFSTYDDDSDLGRLNRHAGLGPLEINRELWSIIEVSLRLGRETEGALDISVGPLIALWRTAEEHGAPPPPASVAEALSRTGTSKVQLLPDGRAELRQAGMQLDLGGIGKGYAVDRLREYLIDEGVERAFINFGRSSLAAIGSPPGREAWPVLLLGDNEEPLGVVHLNDQTLSASSSFGHSSEIEEARYGHLIDPRDGFPLRHPALGVAVARTATEAEALTKALVILGPEEGINAVSNVSTAEGLFAFPDGSRISTSGFNEAVRFEPGAVISREAIS
jgi:thiamine biosynthesis lipoprotein